MTLMTTITKSSTFHGSRMYAPGEPAKSSAMILTTVDAHVGESGKAPSH